MAGRKETPTFALREVVNHFNLSAEWARMKLKSVNKRVARDLQVFFASFLFN